MKVKYKGPSPLSYHSAPSGFAYMFDPGVAQEVQKEDQEFFKSIAKPSGSDFVIVGLKAKIEDKVVTSGKDNFAKNKKKIENGGKH